MNAPKPLGAVHVVNGRRQFVRPPCLVPGCPKDAARFLDTCLDHRDQVTSPITRWAQWRDRLAPLGWFLFVMLIFSGVVFWTVKVVKFAGG